MVAVLVMHTLSSPSSLSLAHLSFHLHLPQSLHSIIPSWLRLPSLVPFASDLPNASEKGHQPFSELASELFRDSVGPFRSDARGFGHPLTALHNFTRACLGLSYPVPDPAISPVASFKHSLTNSYGSLTPSQSTRQPWALLYGVPGYLYERGWKDALFVATLVVVLTLARALWMKYVLLPIGDLCVPIEKEARRSNKDAGQRSKALRSREKKVLRFAEQGFSVTYYTCSWALGLYIASRESYWPLKTFEYWTNYPQFQLDPLFKFYYLASLAFYIQQCFVLHVEERRSDHWQMFSHHIITIALISGSYICSYHRVGNAILCLMDPSDIALSTAKMLKYAGLQTICDVAFGVFMLSWLVTRHILYMFVVWSCVYESRLTNSFHPINWRTGDFFSKEAHHTLIALLLALQVILLTWFYMILRVAYRVLTKNGAVDSRSDAESSLEDDEVDADLLEEDTTLNRHTLQPKSSGTNGYSSSIRTSASSKKRSKRK